MALPAQILTSDAVTAYRNSINGGMLGGIPPVKTAVTMVAMVPPAASLPASATSTQADLTQAASLFYLPRRIASATRIRWRYTQSASTALTGNYVIGIYDASGAKVIDTGSVAFTGATSSVQTRSEPISATTFESGAYYVLYGVDTTNAGSVVFHTLSFGAAWIPNLHLYSATGGVTAPSGITGFTDQHATPEAGNTISGVPFVALSVG